MKDTTTAWTCDGCGLVQTMPVWEDALPLGWLLWHRWPSPTVSRPDINESFCSPQCVADYTPGRTP